MFVLELKKDKKHLRDVTEVFFCVNQYSVYREYLAYIIEYTLYCILERGFLEMHGEREYS